MRVLHLFPRFRPNFAGDGLYFEKLWLHLAAGGSHDVLVFTTPAPAEFPAVAPPGMNLIYLRRSEGESVRTVLLRYYLWLLRNIRRYDIIHARTHIDRFFVSNWIARLVGVRFIYSATLDDSPPYILKTYRPIGRNARAKAAGDYSMAAVAKTYTAFYGSVLVHG
ncbi:MAG: hypothetical protein KGL22_07650 [Alphaproteobacteria bacterium]|nr:hypothetical protein [Alphaproteobacteria bacterium]MDE2513965.1 hypothetical protein [Alphaproteobacteria bacterium]